MRTSIDIDDSLLREAMKLSGNLTKKATVEAGLRLLVQMHAQENIRQLKGKVTWQGTTGKGTASSRAEKHR